MVAFIKLLTSTTLFCAMVFIIYAMSLGPAFAYCAQNWETRRRSAFIRPLYQPLFSVAPTACGWYVRACGVSDIESFFLLNPLQMPQRVSGPLRKRHP